MSEITIIDLHKDFERIIAKHTTSHISTKSLITTYFQPFEEYIRPFYEIQEGFFQLHQEFKRDYLRQLVQRANRQPYLDICHKYINWLTNKVPYEPVFKPIIVLHISFERADGLICWKDDQPILYLGLDFGHSVSQFTVILFHEYAHIIYYSISDKYKRIKKQLERATSIDGQFSEELFLEEVSVGEMMICEGMAIVFTLLLKNNIFQGETPKKNFHLFLGFPFNESIHQELTNRMREIILIGKMACNLKGLKNHEQFFHGISSGVLENGQYCRLGYWMGMQLVISALDSYTIDEWFNLACLPWQKIWEKGILPFCR